jgi:hypothetical protein
MPIAEVSYINGRIPSKAAEILVVLTDINRLLILWYLLQAVHRHRRSCIYLFALSFTHLVYRFP